MSLNDSPLPRWNFTFRNGDTEPYAVNVLQVDPWPGYPPKVTQLAAVERGDVIRVSVSMDSYKAALSTALKHYEDAI